MEFTTINKDNWDRIEYFEHYYSQIPCTYSMTTKIDITKIKKKNHKIYPKMLHSISKVLNNHSEFRTAFNANGELGIFDKMIPCYTIFHKDSETFSNIWTEYSEDYDTFYKSYQKDIELFGSVKKMNAKPNIPENNFPVSMIPWTTFDGFNLNLQKGYSYLTPIFTIGKYYEENGIYKLPLSIQVHHAVCDGFHLCRFINELQGLLAG
ncbi:MAG: type A chloramphenicol O-acetyltransferase [Clostridium sp.]